MPKTPHSSRKPVPVEVDAGLRSAAVEAIVRSARLHHCFGSRREGPEAGTFLLIRASSFCLSIAEPFAAGRIRSSLAAPGPARPRPADRLPALGLRIVRRRRRQLVRRRARARLDPAVDGRRRVLRQHGDDPIGGLGEDRPRPGVLDPFRLLLLRNQPVEDGEGDDGEKEPSRDAEHEPERPIQGADLAVEDRVRQANRKQRNDDQRERRTRSPPQPPGR